MYVKVGRHYVCTYSLSRKTVNTREYFWNVYCFTTNQMRDETAKDKGQTAAVISHGLIQNNELALSSRRKLQFSHCISLKKLFFYHKPTLVTWFCLFKKPNYRIDLKASANCENLQQYRFVSWVRVSQLQKNTDWKLPVPITANQHDLLNCIWTKTQKNVACNCDFVIFLSLSDALSSWVWSTDPVFLITFSCKYTMYVIHIYSLGIPKLKLRKKNFSMKTVKLKISHRRKSQLVVSQQVVTNQCCRFGSYLLRFHLASDWSRNNKLSGNFLWCSQFYRKKCNWRNIKIIGKGFIWSILCFQC